jgi:hypothetical protein
MAIHGRYILPRKRWLKRIPAFGVLIDTDKVCDAVL